jgi:hypothetical protein
MIPREKYAGLSTQDEAPNEVVAVHFIEGMTGAFFEDFLGFQRQLWLLGIRYETVPERCTLANFKTLPFTFLSIST